MMRVLVYGGRDWTSERLTYDAMDKFHATYCVQMLIHGGCLGADSLAAEWAKRHGIHRACVDALWDHYRRAAGPTRNGAMMWLQPQIAVEFPGGNGTADMRSKLMAANVTIWAPYPSPSVPLVPS